MKPSSSLYQEHHPSNHSNPQSYHRSSTSIVSTSSDTSHQNTTTTPLQLEFSHLVFEEQCASVLKSLIIFQLNSLTHSDSYHLTVHLPLINPFQWIHHLSILQTNLNISIYHHHHLNLNILLPQIINSSMVSSLSLIIILIMILTSIHPLIHPRSSIHWIQSYPTITLINPLTLSSPTLLLIKIHQTLS